MSTAAMAAIVTGPRRQYAPRYSDCQVSSMRCGSVPAQHLAYDVAAGAELGGQLAL
ncbi:hypothetical protein GCM10027203_49980 [Nonomuraea fastidiosa]